MRLFITIEHIYKYRSKKLAHLLKCNKKTSPATNCDCSSRLGWYRTPLDQVSTINVFIKKQHFSNVCLRQRKHPRTSWKTSRSEEEVCDLTFHRCQCNFEISETHFDYSFKTITLEMEKYTYYINTCIHIQYVYMYVYIYVYIQYMCFIVFGK